MESRQLCISPLPRSVGKSQLYVGRAVESRPLTFLLVEESQRGSSVGAVDDRLDAVRAVVFLIDSDREAPSSGVL